MNRGEEAVICLHKVWRTYILNQERLDILKGVDLSLNSGESIALVSPSGSGKSTLLHLMGLLELPDGGEITIAGLACQTLPDRARTALRREAIGFVYQFHHLMPEFTALQNVSLPQIIAGKSPGEAEERAETLLKQLGLGARMTHRPAQLSGGEQQRVAIARAVANRPRLLLADEPTGNLDPKTSQQVFEALQAIITTEGLATLVATHNHSLAAAFPRRMMIRDGQLVDLE